MRIEEDSDQIPQSALPKVTTAPIGNRDGRLASARMSEERQTDDGVGIDHFRRTTADRFLDSDGKLDGIAGYLGLQHVSFEPGVFVCDMPIAEHLVTMIGNIHGGCISALIDHCLGVVLYPHMPRGADLPKAVKGQNLPIAGFIEQALRQGHEVLPTVWAGASPAAEVEDDTFEEILSILLKDLEAALPIDGVYLCLHGAMVTESYPDGEAEILSRVRDLVGDKPLVASLDFHANVSAEMVDSGGWEIEVAGERIPARASLRALYDPRGERARG